MGVVRGVVRGVARGVGVGIPYPKNYSATHYPSFFSLTFLPYLNLLA